MLFCNHCRGLQVWEMLGTMWNLHQMQVSILDDFSRGLTILELAALFEAAADVQANLQVYTQNLEALLVDPTLHLQYL